MKTYQELNNTAADLFRLMDLLVPNSLPSDIVLLEENIEEIKETFEKATSLNIFGRLEDLLFESGEEKTKGLIKRILINFEDNKRSWDLYYNRKTFLKAEHSVFLYRNVELKMLIHKTNSLIVNTLQEIRNFNSHYFKSEIKSEILDRLYDSENSIKATIISENTKENRAEKLAFGFIEEKIIKYVNELLSIEIDIKGGWGDFNSQIILSKYDSDDENFPKFEDRLNLDFCMFESKEAQYFEKLKNAEEEIILAFPNESAELQLLAIHQLEAILNNLSDTLNLIVAAHQAFLDDEINANEFWVEIETIFHFPESDKVLLEANNLRLLANAMLKRTDKLAHLLDKIKSIFNSPKKSQAVDDSILNGTVSQSEKDTLNIGILKKSLKDYGFFDLPLVKALEPEKLTKLIYELHSNEIPFCIAMLDYLGFLKNLRKVNFNTKKEMYDYLAIIFYTAVRTIKGNVAVLDDFSKENRARYTAHNFKQQVITDYQRLK
jgi:hypothetical protein